MPPHRFCCREGVLVAGACATPSQVSNITASRHRIIAEIAGRPLPSPSSGHKTPVGIFTEMPKLRKVLILPRLAVRRLCMTRPAILFHTFRESRLPAPCRRGRHRQDSDIVEGSVGRTLKLQCFL